MIIEEQKFNKPRQTHLNKAGVSGSATQLLLFDPNLCGNCFTYERYCSSWYCEGCCSDFAYFDCLCFKENGYKDYSEVVNKIGEKGYDNLIKKWFEKMDKKYPPFKIEEIVKLDNGEIVSVVKNLLHLQFLAKYKNGNVFVENRLFAKHYH